MFFMLKGAPHLLQSYLRVAQDCLPPKAREMYLSFENLTIIGALGLRASLMDINHDTSLRFILENDFISSTSKDHVRSCSGKGAWLWLVTRPSICSFCITHFIFTSTLHFHLGLINLQHLIFSCVSVDTSWTHLTHT
jgi:hypothetical protein